MCMFPALINKVSTFQVGAKALILVVSGSLLHNHLRSRRNINRLVAAIEEKASKPAGRRSSI